MVLIIVFSFFDYLKVFMINNGEDKVLFNKIILSKLDKEKIQIISFVLSQSVALERYEVKIEQRLNELAKIIENIKLNLKKEFKEQYLLSQISDIFLIKQKAISHLSLFDKPDTTWEKPEIEKLYNKLYLYFELEDRFDILNEKLNFYQKIIKSY
jgi:required for meiotic nuclear division protein 1